MKNWFGKPKAVGISATELEAAQQLLRTEYANTAVAHKKPTEYMPRRYGSAPPGHSRRRAIDVLCELEPHEL